MVDVATYQHEQRSLPTRVYQILRIGSDLSFEAFYIPESLIQRALGEQQPKLLAEVWPYNPKCPHWAAVIRNALHGPWSSYAEDCTTPLIDKHVVGSIRFYH